ncbi:hypothetical protein [Streptomyces sp. NPDC048611]|uniref:hypothetical protein n=1 Tax=Streptomyces sp. NPDC048611 TaxID=3155635 RepID=UPI0034356919
MAIAIPSPASVADDLVTIEEALAFVAQSGHPMSRTTLNRLIGRRRIRVARRGRRNVVSMSDVLVAHRDWLDGVMG